MDRSPGPRPHRLLIAGDPALSRGLMRTVLSRLGYLVSVASTGTEALAMRPNMQFSAALVAARLPDMAGLTLARHLASAPFPISVLLFGDPFDRRLVESEVHNRARIAFLAKPLSLGRLVATLKRLADGEPATSAAEPPMSSLSSFDRTRLREFSNGDPALEQELANLFLETASLYLDQMAASLTDPERWRRAAHALKGASANIGATEIAALAGAAERAAPSRELVAELEARLRALRAELSCAQAHTPCAL